MNLPRRPPSQPGWSPPQDDRIPPDPEAHQPRETIRRAPPGRKGKKGKGGGFQPLGAGRGYKARDRGPYPRAPGRVKDSRTDEVPLRPLTRAAVSLLIEYHRRRALWNAVEEWCPVDRVGRHVLGLALTRAYDVLAELKRHNGPVGWFQHCAWEKMKEGKIGPGRGTEPSRDADAFFIGLLGGVAEVRRVQDEAAEEEEQNEEFDLDRVRRKYQRAGAPVIAEIYDYFVYSGLIWRVDEWQSL